MRVSTSDGRTSRYSLASRETGHTWLSLPPPQPKAVAA